MLVLVLCQHVDPAHCAVSVDRNMSIINETLKVTEGDIVSSTCTPGPPESPAAGAGAAEGGPRRPVSPRPRRADWSHMAAIHQLLQVNSQLSATLTTLLVSPLLTLLTPLSPPTVSWASLSPTTPDYVAFDPPSCSPNIVTSQYLIIKRVRTTETDTPHLTREESSRR